MTKATVVSNTKEVQTMTKEELVAAVLEYEDLLLYLEEKICTVKIKPEGRKAQVLKILQSEGHITVTAIAKRIGITARNVSSQLSYLRTDGFAIATDSLGRKFLESDKPATQTQPTLHEEPSTAKVITRKAS